MLFTARFNTAARAYKSLAIKPRSRSRGQDGFQAGFRSVLEALGLSRVSVLLLFVPFALAAGAMKMHNQTAIFVLNAIAIVPLTNILTRTTESISERIGVALGALLNITLGNIVELIML